MQIVIMLVLGYCSLRAPHSLKGCQIVAGGRSVAQTTGIFGKTSQYPEGVQEGGFMGSTFFSLHYHFVFSTKNRVPTIDAEWRPRMHSYLGGIIRGMNGVAEIVGGVADHVHILVSLRPVHRIADVMRDLKKESSTWAKDNFSRRFEWQEGYAVFSVSPSATSSVKNYIANQEASHAKYSFIDELKELLGKAGIEYHQKYLL